MQRLAGLLILPLCPATTHHRHRQRGAGATVNLLVDDQLSTPRMVVDQTGSLAGVKRHDYLPFGEEIGAGVGGRATAQGYSGTDNVRQKFTGYERDSETELDFAQARYFSSVQGRFTGVDPLLASGGPANPKTWNRYAYALNNPLGFADPTGLAAQDPQLPPGTANAPACFPHCTLPAGQYPLLNETVTITSSSDPLAIPNDVVLETLFAIPMANPTEQPAWGGASDQTKAGDLFFEFLFGVGPTHRTFGPDSNMTQGMMTSPDVTTHRQEYCRGACSGDTSYGPADVGQFGVPWGAEDGPFEATYDMSWPRHFVGSFDMTITQRATGDTLFEINNVTSRRSALYHLPFLVNNERSGARSINNLNIMANTRQTYWWTERNPCGCR